MVAIKDMEMPKDCKKCPLMGTDGNPKDLLNPMMCVAIWATTHEIKHCVEGKILDDCPLVEIEERKAGKWEETRYRSYDPQSHETYDDGIGFRCSNCANVFKVTSLARYHYCPNCGAEMRGSENE